MPTADAVGRTGWGALTMVCPVVALPSRPNGSLTPRRSTHAPR